MSLLDRLIDNNKKPVQEAAGWMQGVGDWEEVVENSSAKLDEVSDDLDSVLRGLRGNDSRSAAEVSKALKLIRDAEKILYKLHN